MNELCTDGDVEQLKDAISIRQEFAEWLLRDPISGESTSCRSENQKEQSVELQASQTGNDTTEALRILSRILAEMARILSEEKSSPSTQPLDK